MSQLFQNTTSSNNGYSDDELISMLLSSQIKLHQLTKYTHDENRSAKLRRQYLAAKFGVNLDTLDTNIDFNKFTGKNIDNPVGAVRIPLGIAGPLEVRGDFANSEYPIYLATSEGALVASVNRGISVLNSSGGAHVKIISKGMTRAPVLACADVNHAYQVKEWVESHFGEIKSVAESTTRHGKLKSIQPFIVGRNLFLRFVFDTADAMGMNMATIATRAASDYIQSETGAKLVATSGNVCTDKKPSWINRILGRGYYVVAESTIPSNIIETKLKTTPSALVEANYRKNHVGSAFAGASPNAHVANIVAAMFIALGQDAAHVVDASQAFTTVESADDGVYFSVTVPALYVGTVGGGTRLPDQSALLKSMGLYGPNNAEKFAEVVAAAALAGEVSLIGALAAGHLTKAHKELGR